MTWTKLSDDYSDDTWTLSDAAFRLHTEGLIWSNRKLLDCRIPRDDVRRFAKRPEALGELLACNWWREDGDVYEIRHHAAYQRTRDEVLSRQAVNRANGAKGGRPPKATREQVADLGSRTRQETHSLSDSVTHSLSESRTDRDRTGSSSGVDPDPGTTTIPKPPPAAPSASRTDRTRDLGEQAS